MISIDLATILLLYETSLVAGALAFLHMRRQSQNSRGLGRLALAFGLLSSGAMTAWLGQLALLPMAAWTLVSLMIGVAGYSLLWAGLVNLSQGRNSRPLFWLVLLLPLLCACLGLATDFHLDDRRRSALFHGTAAICLLASARAIWRDRRIEPLPTRAPLAAILLLAGLVFTAVGVVIPLVDVYTPWIAVGFFIQILGNFGIAILICGMVTDRAESQLRLIAEFDSLTGVGNRRWMQARLPKHLYSGDAVIILDLDHFKSVNDRFGHAAGDAVLCDVAQVLQNAIRPQDSLARYGGEEFVIYLANIGQSGAIALAERLRQLIASLNIHHRGHTIQTSISLGVVVADNDGSSWEQLYTAADAALYTAKHQGRNKTVLSTAVLAV